jgi:uncharacterized protein YggE
MHMKCINKFFSDTKYAISWGILSFIIVTLLASIYLIFSIFAIVDSDTGYNVITVEGEAEVFAVPDIATFNFTVTETSEDASVSQENTAKKVESAIDALKKEGVDEKDIKTSSYNSYPKYEWIQTECVAFPCEPGKRELVGYEVRQTVSVKVRDTDKAGSILADIADLGIGTVSGISFTIDDEDALKEQARSAAIADAKAKAKKMAKELGVKLDDIVSFSEGDDPYYYDSYGVMEARSLESPKVDAELPLGENKIVSRVYITFEIK